VGTCEGMVALVTGASQGGTGRAVAVRLAAEGAKVAITARSQEGLDETCSMIESFGGTVVAFACDMGDPEPRAELVPRTEEQLGPIDILVSNAVAHAQKPVDQWALDELEWYGQVNLWGPWVMMAQVLPGMRERGRGWVLNLTSFSGELPPGPPFAFKAKDGSSMYGATKAALNRLTVAAAGEHEGTGVAVNALTPQSAILTPAVEASGLVSSFDLFEPVEAMAEAALALCTGDPAVLTGRIAYSLQLLLELDRPMRDLYGKELVAGWQPVDLPAHIKVRSDFNAETGWPDSYNFHRPHTPYPAQLASL